MTPSPCRDYIGVGLSGPSGRLVDCLNTYEEAGLQNKFEFAMASHEMKISKFNDDMSLTATADCDENDLSTVQSAGSENYSEIFKHFQAEQVKVNNNFKGVRADTSGKFYAVGQLVVNERTDEFCNVTYVEFPSGEKGFCYSVALLIHWRRISS
jgi:hypothetical protein